MKAIDIYQIKNAKLLHINHNSVVLETLSDGVIYCHRNIYNQLINEAADFPCFITSKPDVKGNEYPWVAIPKTV